MIDSIDYKKKTSYEIIYTRNLSQNVKPSFMT